MMRKVSKIMYVKLGLTLIFCTMSFTAFSAGPYDKWNALIKKAGEPPQPNEVVAADAPATVTTTEIVPLPNSVDSDSMVQANSALITPKAEVPLTLRQEAFRQLLEKNSPLTPEQILQFRKFQNETEQAINTPIIPPPRPISSTITVDLSPGSIPSIIRLAKGFVSSLVFVDGTGQTWPIVDYSLGNAKHFNLQVDTKTGTIFLQSMADFSTGNMAIRLAKLDTPVVLTFVTGQKEVDFRVDIQVPGRGPNALDPIGGDFLPKAAPTSLLSVLDGIPPEGSKELEFTGGLGRAWLSHGKLILRTKMTILSPAWSATISSPDGTHVYEMMQTPLILASMNGKPVKIELKGL